MTQSSSDNVYLSLTFGNIPRTVADKVREAAETAAGDYDVSVDYGDPIGDQPTPVFEETADAVGSTPVTSDATQVVTGEENSPVADEGTDAPVVPDAQPTPAPVMTATDDATPPAPTA